jgi:hypothetical protein
MEFFWPTRGTCSLNTDDVGLVDEGLQRREGCRRARGTPCILGGNIAIQKDTRYIQEGSAVGGKKPLRREPGSHSNRRCPFRGRGYPSDICVRCPARNIVDPMQGVLTIVPNRTYHLPSKFPLDPLNSSGVKAMRFRSVLAILFREIDHCIFNRSAFPEVTIFARLLTILHRVITRRKPFAAHTSLHRSARRTSDSQSRDSSRGPKNVLVCGRLIS